MEIDKIMQDLEKKPLLRFITDEVEMGNLHSTIWGTVHFSLLPGLEWVCLPLANEWFWDLPGSEWAGYPWQMSILSIYQGWKKRVAPGKRRFLYLARVERRKPNLANECFWDLPGLEWVWLPLANEWFWDLPGFEWGWLPLANSDFSLLPGSEWGWLPLANEWSDMSPKK